jgi:hypothetical protein
MVNGAFHGVPVPLLVAAWTSAAMAAGWFARTVWRWLSASSQREWDEVLTLRKALDRLRRRENAYATGFELVLIVIPPELTPEQHMVVDRARQLFAVALFHPDGES